MSDIKYVLNKLNSNTSNLSSITSQILSTTRQGFEDSKADRQMSDWKTEQYREWIKENECKKQGKTSFGGLCF